MKKYVLLAALTLSGLASAQSYPYPGGYPEDGYYQSGSDWGYDDDFYNYAYNSFPDEYYYEFPSDYYPGSYYESYYNDYRKSIAGIDWDRLFIELNLNRYQIQQIIALNRRFPNFNSWDLYYRMNPNRWYYDRFYMLERILGPHAFAIFQNLYYNGYSPVRYFQNYRRNYYVQRYVPVPKYRNVNINNYNLGRDRYFQNSGRRYGYRDNHSPGGLSGSTSVPSPRVGAYSGRTAEPYRSQSGGFRTRQSDSNMRTDGEASAHAGGVQGTVRGSGGFRNSESIEKQRDTSLSREASGGFRNGSAQQDGAAPRESRSAGMRTGGGFR